MSSVSHLARRFRYLRLLRGALSLVAAADLLFAALLVFSPATLASYLGWPALESVSLAGGAAALLYRHLATLLIALLALTMLLAARQVRRYSAVIALGIGGRVGIALLLGGAAATSQGMSSLWPLAGANLAAGLLIAALWRPVYG